MADLQKPVGATATFTATVTNAEGVPLPDAVVTFTDDAADTVTPDPAAPQSATVTGTVIETVTVTATVSGVSGPISAAAAVDFVDNVPAGVSVAVS